MRTHNGSCLKMRPQHVCAVERLLLCLSALIWMNFHCKQEMKENTNGHIQIAMDRDGNRFAGKPKT